MFKTLTGSLDLKSKPSDDEISKIPSYIFCRWLSGHPAAITVANMINYYSDIPIINQYHLVKKAFGGKIKYIPYPKADKADNSKDIEYIAQHFKINEHLAKEYIQLMDKKEYDKIVNMYKEHELKGK